MPPLAEGDKNVWIWQDHCYAELYENGVGSTITVTTAGTYYPWITSIVGITQGEECTLASADTDSLVVGIEGGGLYMVMATVSFRGAKDAIVRGAVFLNGVKQDNLSFSRFVDSTTDRGAASINGLLLLVNDDVITLRFTSDSNGDIIIVYDVNFHAIRIAPTP